MSANPHLLGRLFVVEALRALGRHKLRTTLAALGVTIGIASVVCMVALGQAGADRAEAQLANLGDNLVWVEAGSRNVAGVRTGSHGTTTLTLEDAQAIAREIPLVKAMSPNVDGTLQAVHQGRNWTTRFRGVYPEYLEIKRWPVAEGRAFTREEDDGATNVVLLGTTTKHQLFGDEEAIGQTIEIQSAPFQVVGILSTKGQSASGQDQDDAILMPYRTAQKRIRGKGFEWIDDVMLSAYSMQDVDPAVEKITSLMRQRHRIESGQEDDFNMRRPDEVIKAQIQASETLELLLVAIASISLLVGGVGIMNVMLVSVSQRTREIGVRMAVGATGGDIQVQFLGESVMLSLCGGVLGIGLGLVSSHFMGAALQWPVEVPVQALLIAPPCAVATGVFFGFYPAWRASQLDPIEALRSD